MLIYIFYLVMHTNLYCVVIGYWTKHKKNGNITIPIVIHKQKYNGTKLIFISLGL